MISQSIRAFRSLLVAATVVLCSQSATQAIDLSGHWTGTWHSGSSRHQGPLQADFVRLAPDRYEVYFNGRFLLLVPFKYSTVMTASEDGGIVTLTGSKYLGRLFGTFSFAATATDWRFDANFSSCKDNGCFKMTRCTRARSCCEN